jgi:hypothetical protein
LPREHLWKCNTDTVLHSVMSAGAETAARRPTCPFSAGHISSSSSSNSSSSSTNQHRVDPAIQQAMCTATQKGVPCYSMEAVVSADIIDGRPASAQQLRAEPWRAGHVKSYAVPISM